MASDLSLYLASKSPRRKDILEQLGFHPIVLANNDHTLRNFQGDEVQLPNETPQDYVERIAREKAVIALGKIQAQALPLLPVLSADTTVIADGLILGKPDDETQAQDFLRRLSGKEHEVRTAVCVGTDVDNLLMRVSISTVRFKALTETEIRSYVRMAEPYDKAGGYGIQGLAGAFISEIHGSYSGIMGLPVFETCELLKSFGLDLFAD